MPKRLWRRASDQNHGSSSRQCAAIIFAWVSNPVPPLVNAVAGALSALSILAGPRRVPTLLIWLGGVSVSAIPTGSVIPGQKRRGEIFQGYIEVSQDYMQHGEKLLPETVRIVFALSIITKTFLLLSVVASVLVATTRNTQPMSGIPNAALG